MREALLAVIVLTLAIAGLIKPRIAMLAWIWYALARPDFLAFASRDNNFSTVLALVAMFGGLRYLAQAKMWIRNPICVGILLLVFLAFLSRLFMLSHDDISIERFNSYVRMMAIVLFLPVLLNALKDLRDFLLVIACSIGIVGVKIGLFGLLHGGVRFANGYGGFMGDNNGLASAMVTLLPICWYMREVVQSKVAQLILAVMAICMVATIVMTYSRGGALGLGLICLVMLFRAKNRLRVGLALGIICAVPIYMVGESWTERLETVKTPEEERSAKSRMLFAQAGVEIWKDYPIFGVGFGMRNEQFLIKKYVEADGDDYGNLVLHNTYMQTLVDCGTFAFLTYVTTLFGTIIWLGFSIRRTRKEYPQIVVYPIALQTALIGFSLTSTFLSEMHVDFLYIVLMGAAIWFEFRRRLGEGEVEPDELGQAAEFAQDEPLPVAAQ
jgi:putative inorganic carbon (hco3(-)) transporter